MPIMRILEIVPSTADAMERERRWIEACVSAGLDILNAASLPKREIAQIAERVEAVRSGLARKPAYTEAERRDVLRLHFVEGVPASLIAQRMNKGGQFYYQVRAILQQARQDAGATEEAED